MESVSKQARWGCSQGRPWEACLRKIAWTVWIVNGAALVWGQTAPVDPAVMRRYEAQVTAASGTVDRVRDEIPWAVAPGERVPVRQTITTGSDGYAKFAVQGGTTFELLSNSKVIFRGNTASAGDLLDVIAGRVRVHLQPGPGQWRLRIFCPDAIVTASQPASLAVAVAEDGEVRVDVTEGEIRVQHTLIPRSEPVVVKSVDAILIRPDEPISRRVERGSLYRLTAKILDALMPGHRSNDPIEGKPLLARAFGNPPIEWW